MFPIGLGAELPPQFVPALERVIESERRRYPRASDKMLLSLLLQRGLVFTHDAIAAGITLDPPVAPLAIGVDFADPQRSAA